MKREQFFEDLKNRYVGYEHGYRALIVGSNDAINRSKRAIFACHRGDIDGGKALLVEVAKMLGDFESKFNEEPGLRFEGAYRSSMEEFFEASFYVQFLENKTLGPVPEFKNADPELYLGALSDLTGELVRYAVAKATIDSRDEVRRAKIAVEEVMSFLISLDLTGYLRSKYDQAKNSMRRMEEIIYDVSLKGKSV